MSDFVANSINITKVHIALKRLLGSYLSEKEESRRDEDAYFMEYWESACQTIYDVAAALNIPLEVEPVNCSKTGCQFLQPPTYPEHNVGP